MMLLFCPSSPHGRCHCCRVDPFEGHLHENGDTIPFSFHIFFFWLQLFWFVHKYDVGSAYRV